MKVLDLRCGAGHAFEGWFASEADYHAQCAQGLVDCPVCGNADVAKLPSAPRLNLSGARAPSGSAKTPASAAPGSAAGGPAAGVPVPAAPPGDMAVAGAVAQRFMQAVSELMKNTEDVGERFAEEARRIHYGEADPKAIRGQTTPEEREALADEGIEVFTLPVPVRPKGPLQ